ncbi:HopJ type III effector protein [Sphingobacterium lumbrici]|uniref:HopJ type III effector protein n=1 Tax=Sphingobacterium lumbrici TaxID=2559600 RepID=UPI00112E0813|nr:HopJ type III effector protein [Sphingobacterium lumbrici]
MAQELIQRLKNKEVKFEDVLAFIDERYLHTPTAFTNGKQYNTENENQGSAKVFSFAQINGLSKEDTLLLFAEHREAVLASPDATDHQNIRQFILNGWEGVTFEGIALQAK